MRRAIHDKLIEDLNSKLVLLSGPRQVGKTTLSQSIFKNYQYLNYDAVKDRKAIREQTWGRSADLVIFDELHKLKNWKRFLKGIVDTEGIRPRLLVTGSARLDIVRKMGDSLAGRHFAHTLHPLTLKELCQGGKLRIEERVKHFNTLLTIGGFPEPFLNGSETFARRWRRSHLDIILRQDLLDLEQVRSISQIETLIELLKERVGSLVSLQNLAQDLQVDFKTVKRWIEILENLFIVFAVTPYSKNVARGLTKMKKYYFFDTGQVEGEPGVRLENLVACSLLREIDFLSDTEGRKLSLHYIRDRNGKEIDFVVVEKSALLLMCEVKWADDSLSPNFKTFSNLSAQNKIQLLGTPIKRREVGKGYFLVSAQEWLCTLGF